MFPAAAMAAEEKIVTSRMAIVPAAAAITAAVIITLRIVIVCFPCRQHREGGGTQQHEQAWPGSQALRRRIAQNHRGVICARADSCKSAGFRRFTPPLNSPTFLTMSASFICIIGVLPGPSAGQTAHLLSRTSAGRDPKSDPSDSANRQEPW